MNTNKHQTCIEPALPCLVWLLMQASMVARANPLDDFAALEAAMNKAVLAHEIASPSASDNHSKAGTAVKSKQTDRRLEILQDMDEFVGRIASQPDAGSVETQVFLWAIDLAPKSTFPRFERLASRYPNDSSLEEAVAYTVYTYKESAKPTDWLRTLQSLARESKREPTRLAALFSSGLIKKEIGDTKSAGEDFKQVLKLGPQSANAEGAKINIHEIEHLQVGMPAPDFTTKTLDGRTISLKSLRGKVVLLDVWATWCPPCVAEFPHLKKAAKVFEQHPFEILSVSVDDDRESVSRLVKALKAPGIHTWDEKGSENPVANLYAVQQYPTWFLIDQKGVIRGRDPFGDKLIESVRSLLGLKAESSKAETSDEADPATTP